MALFPPRHREEVGTRRGLLLEVCGACEIERSQCGMEMNIEDRLSTGLTLGQAGELLAVAKEDFNRLCRKVANNILLSTICGIFYDPSFQYVV
jgi:hypothetical protein